MKKIILNHKMNLYYQDLDNYINRLNQINNNLIVAPSNIYLIEFLKRTHHQVSSQDVCYIEDGNYTGKVSWSQIKSLGIKYSIIGHSEKNDTKETINQKLKACLDNNITPILCFGNQTKEEDITKLLNNINIYNNKIIYAYEPIFNIGKEAIDIEYIQEQINIIYNYLKEQNNIDPTIIYGGGINYKNINKIYNLNKISGILIGSISSNIDELEKLLLKIEEK